jgi:serine/threonine protein kinase
MDLGSLYDILHDDTKVLGEELLYPILQDVAKGMRFLHASDPPVIHGDLKVSLLNRIFDFLLPLICHTNENAARDCLERRATSL